MRLAVIGCGRFGENHTRILKELGHEVYIYDYDRKRVDELSQKYDVKVLNDLVKPKAVFIATPSNTHYDIVKELY